MTSPEFIGKPNDGHDRQPMDSIIPSKDHPDWNRIHFAVDSQSEQMLLFTRSIENISITEAVRRGVCVADFIVRSQTVRIIVHDKESNVPLFDVAPFKEVAPTDGILKSVNVNIALDVTKNLENALASYPEHTVSSLLNHALWLNSQLSSYDQTGHCILGIDAENSIYGMSMKEAIGQAFSEQLGDDTVLRDFLKD